MSILVVGSVAYDSVETPFGKVTDALGGSALFFSSAARFFAPVNMVGVVGKDFDFAEIEFLKKPQVDLEGLVVEEGETFRWGGKYFDSLDERETLYTYLNVFENFDPVIPEKYRKSKYVFLANIDPELQLKVLDSIEKPKLVVLDTMNFWISGMRKELDLVIKKVDMAIFNEEEVYQLTEIPNLFDAAKKILQGGLKTLVIKRGKYGSILATQNGYFFGPAYPVTKVVDPTGAGDSFAGGLIGYLAECEELNETNLRKAAIYGTVVASFNVEDFSFNRLKQIDRQAIESRLEELRKMTTF
jgi:sugar/nucleoside kinase (ribokinase family)